MPSPLLQYIYGPPQWPAVDARRGIPANSVKSLSAQHEAIGRRRGHAGRSAAAAAVVAESVDMRSELRAVLLSHGGACAGSVAGDAGEFCGQHTSRQLVSSSDFWKIFFPGDDGPSITPSSPKTF